MKTIKLIALVMVVVFFFTSVAMAARARKLSVGDVVTKFLKKGSNGDLWSFATEKGARYKVFVIDGYNKSSNKSVNPQLELTDNPIKAVWFQILKADNKTLLPQEAYMEYNKSKSRGHGGYTPESVGHACEFTADETKAHLFVWGSKAEYEGNYKLLIVKQ